MYSSWRVQMAVGVGHGGLSRKDDSGEKSTDRQEYLTQC